MGVAAGQSVHERDTPRLNPTANIRALQLTAREGYLLSRIDGHTPPGLLSELLGTSRAEVEAMLERLENLGAILWRAEQLGQARPAPAEGTGPAGMGPGLEAALAEDCDLNRAERLRILAALRDIRERTHWHVLGLRGDPSPADIKRAYFALSKQFHPDRFYGRKLGTFRGRLHEVFEGIKTAYQVLSDPARGAAYRQAHPPPPSDVPPLNPTPKRFRPKEEPSGPLPSAETRRRLEARRQEILEERRRQRARPAEERAQRARQLFEEGLHKLEKEDVVGAASCFRLALTFAPQNEEYKARLEEVEQRAIRVQVQELEERAGVEIATGQTASAAHLYAEASNLLPASSSLALKAAELFGAVANLEQANRMIRRALKASPRRKEVRLLAAELAEKAGQLEAAISHLEVAATLDRADGRVKKSLKRLSQKLSEAKR